MSLEILCLTNRLNQTESAVFQTLDAVDPNQNVEIVFQIVENMFSLKNEFELKRNVSLHCSNMIRFA